MRRSGVSSILLVSASLVFASCMGEKGADGDVYLRYSWNSSTLESYGDTTPLSYISNSHQKVPPGTYSFDYLIWRGDELWEVWGTFTLVANPGKDGEIFWQKGDDGDTKYYTLTIGSYRATLSKRSSHSLVKVSPFAGKAFDPGLPIETRADTTEGTIVLWRYQEQQVAR